MTHRILWCAVGVLGAICLAQTYRLHAQKAPPRPMFQDIVTQQDRWIEEMTRELSPKTSVPFGKFDELFNDEFFKRNIDPFREIEEFHRRVGPALSDEQRPLFGRSWDDWFHERMEVSDIRSGIKTTESEVIVSFRIPGLQGASLRIDVNPNRIKVAYAVKTAKSTRRFEKIMPIPAEAEALKYRTAREGDTFKIIFKRRSLKS